MAAQTPVRLHVYVDESGRPEVFGRDGHSLLATGQTPNHFVVAAVRTTKPSTLGEAMANAAPDPEHPRPLHALDDSPGRRRIVCAALAKQDVIAIAVAMDKRLLVPGGEWEQDRVAFYNAMLAYALSDSLHLRSETLVTVSHKDHDRGRDLAQMAKAVYDRHDEVLSRLRQFRAHEVRMKQRSYHNSRGLQAADYVAYAVLQAFEHQNLKLYNILQPIIGRIWDIGRLTSYTRKRPMLKPPGT